VRRSDPPCFGREELFYQLGLRQFGNFPKLKLDPPAPLRPLITLAVDAEQNTELSNLSKPQIVDVSDCLIMRLFRPPRIVLTGASRSSSTVYCAYPYLPERDAKRVLLAGYHDRRDGRQPSCNYPRFDPELGQTSAVFHATWPTGEHSVASLIGGRCSVNDKVNWNSEQECFDTFLRELAYFYVPGPAVLAEPSAPGCNKDDSDNTTNASQGEASEKWQIEHVLFPAMKRYMTGPKSLLTRDVVQIASLPDLYRVFERC